VVYDAPLGVPFGSGTVGQIWMVAQAPAAMSTVVETTISMTSVKQGRFDL
jgi:hypothetical protein